MRISVVAKEWFDKINGNSYFSARITVSGRVEMGEHFVLPLQYGYGDQYITAAREKLVENGILPNFEHGLVRYCRDNGIELHYDKHERCLKRVVKQWGEL